MRYTEKDIARIRVKQFMDALGEKPVKKIGSDLLLYYAPHRDDTEPMFMVDTLANIWHDHGAHESGNLRMLAELTARGDHRNDITAYIVKVMNEYQVGKEMLRKQAIEPQVVHLDIAKVPLTDFMKALGQKHPVAADDDLRIYNAPYDSSVKGTMVINIRTNLWRDTKSGANGGIYDLAYELTGCANKSELNRYIAGEMKAYKQCEQKKPEVKPESPKAETNQPKRKMRR